MPEGAFEEPSFDVEVDVEQYLSAVTPGTMSRGVFLTSVCDFVERELGSVPNELFDGLSRKRWVAFSRVPMTQFMTMIVNAARLVYADESLAEGLRRIGWFAYESFASTMAGRVVLFALGEGLEQVLLAAPKAYAVTVPGSSVSTKRTDDGSWLLELRSVPSFADSYHFGVVEGTVRAHGFEPTIRIRRQERISDVDYRLRWR